MLKAFCCIVVVLLVLELGSKAYSTETFYSRTLLSEKSNNCSKVFKFDSSNILAGPGKLDLVGVKDISSSIGYSVIDAVKSEQGQERPNDACKIRLARIINKFGVPVTASAEGAQAAIRGTNMNDVNIQSCPGFGIDSVYQSFILLNSHGSV